MKTSKAHPCFRPRLAALALAAAMGCAGQAHQAWAADYSDEEITQYTHPDKTEVSVGAAASSGNRNDRGFFGQYNGFSKDSGGLLLDYDYVRRDASGLWLRSDGVNLGQDNRELRISIQQQGNWKFKEEYSEQTRHEPRVLNSTASGLGSNAIFTNANPGASANTYFDLRRRSISLSGEKQITPSLSAELSFKNENKDGSRLLGMSPTLSAGGITTLSGYLLPLVEPVNSTTQQLEFKLNYFDKELSLTGGYYGSFYSNRYNTLTLTPYGLPSALNGASNNFALTPDNQAHQLNASGSYKFSKDTRASFSLAYTHATQSDNGSFAASGLPGSLNGAVDRTFAQLSLTHKLNDDISLLASGRHEEVEDKTPLAAYGYNDTASTTSTNNRNSSVKENGKIEAVFKLPDNYRALLGAEWDYVKRNKPVATAWISPQSLGYLRETTGEGTYRAELRRVLSEDLNGALAVSHSKREGYHWFGLAAGAGYPFVPYASVYGQGAALPITMLDRERDKLRLTADWQATKNFSIQFLLEDGKDKYAGSSSAGVQDTGMTTWGVDAALVLSDDWKLTGYVNQGKQTLHVNPSATYLAALDDTSTTFGLGARGKINDQLDVGADLTLLDDVSRYNQSLSTGAAGNLLPNITYKTTTLNLFGKYALDKFSDVRVDLIHQRISFNEWSWAVNGVPFQYADNSIVTLQPNQNVTFIGARYIYRFR